MRAATKPRSSSRLKERYEDRDGVVEREARAFVADLREKGLVQD